MIIRAVDENHDWTFGKGLSDFAQAEQAIEQNIQSRILSWVGDCFFALQEGVDWKNRLEVGQKNALTDELRSIILQSTGVMALNSIAVTFDGETRVYSATYNIDTIYTPSFSRTIEIAAGVQNA